MSENTCWHIAAYLAVSVWTCGPDHGTISLQNIQVISENRSCIPHVLCSLTIVQNWMLRAITLLSQPCKKQVKLWIITVHNEDKLHCLSVESKWSAALFDVWKFSSSFCYSGIVFKKRRNWEVTLNSAWSFTAESTFMNLESSHKCHLPHPRCYPQC